MITNDAMEDGRSIVPKPSSKNPSPLSTTKNIRQSQDNSSKSKIRVFIVDDLRLVCEGLEAIFADDRSIEIVGFALNGREAIAQIDKIKPDVVILDLLMPGMDGIEVTKKVTQKYPELKVIILTSSEDDSIVSEVIAAGANGYMLKSMVISELALAIRSVYNGSYHFAAGHLNSLATIASQNFDSNAFNFASQNSETVDLPVVSVTPKTIAKKAKSKKSKKSQPEKPLLPYIDWVLGVSGVIVLLLINSASHNLAHAGLFLLMLTLIASPLRAWWDVPLKYRQGIGVIAFVAALAHAIYATRDFFEGNLATISLMSTQNKWGMWAGIVSLTIMAAVAVTSLQFVQRNLGKIWRQIHLLSLPSMILAVGHTILVGPHYLMPDAHVEVIDYSRTGAVIAVAVLIWLFRQRIAWSKLKLKLDNLGRSAKKQLKA
jgi:DNA-binding NarL/FixJ family response regulator/DMSO/TMAO reductase YedYZ heme-binding membrane subunit